MSEPLPTGDGIKTDLDNARLRNALQLAKPSEQTERIDKSEDLNAACTRAWPYYDQACMLKRGNARVVRVIDLDRQLRLGGGKRPAP